MASRERERSPVQLGLPLQPSLHQCPEVFLQLSDPLSALGQHALNLRRLCLMSGLRLLQVDEGMIVYLTA